MRTTIQMPRPAAIVIALHSGSGLISRLIRWQTRSAFSHASVVINDGSARDGTLVEAREGRGVVAERTLRDALDAGERVRLFSLPCTRAQRDRALAFMAAQIGKGYDWTMVLRFVSRRQESRRSTGKWFCSELVFAAVLEAGIRLLNAEPWAVSPGRLAESPLLVDQGEDAAELYVGGIVERRAA